MSELLQPDPTDLYGELHTGITRAITSDFSVTLEHIAFTNPADRFLRRYIILEQTDSDSSTTFFAGASAYVYPVIRDEDVTSGPGDGHVDLHLINTKTGDYLWLSLDPTDNPDQPYTYISRLPRVGKTSNVQPSNDIFLDSMGYKMVPPIEIKTSTSLSMLYENMLLKLNEVLHQGSVSPEAM